MEGTIHKGNSAEYSSKLVAQMENSPLEGKKILFLGSSVTLYEVVVPGNGKTGAGIFADAGGNKA